MAKKKGAAGAAKRGRPAKAGTKAKKTAKANRSPRRKATDGKPKAGVVRTRAGAPIVRTLTTVPGWTFSQPEMPSGFLELVTGNGGVAAVTVAGQVSGWPSGTVPRARAKVYLASQTAPATPPGDSVALNPNETSGTVGGVDVQFDSPLRVLYPLDSATQKFLVAVWPGSEDSSGMGGPPTYEGPQTREFWVTEFNK